jgi:hypothetical protein
MGHFNLKLLGIAMALVVFTFVSCSSNPEGEIAQGKQQSEESSNAMSQSQQEPSVTPGEAAMSQETSPESDTIVINGKVEEGPEGIIISSDDGAYAVSGQDLSDKIGMTVKITGALRESEGSRTIEVTDVEIVQ